MNVGLVARCDDRGIGTMTWEFARAMRPDRVLVVREPGAERRGFEPHPERFPDGEVVHFDTMTGQLSERVCREFLDGLDVVYLVETSYDPRFFQWAREAHCASVLHAMPEFWRWHQQTERPDVWWLPTTWRADLLPAECRIVEVPVPDRLAQLATPGPATFVHVAGHRAVGDRNGTLSMFQAVRTMRSECTVRIVSQDRLPRIRPVANVTVEAISGGVDDRWALYADADALVLPRRYGGLCLPALEAMACGLGLVMTASEPQASAWPICGVPATPGRTIEMPCGPIRLNDVHPRSLGQALDTLAEAPAVLTGLRSMALEFAEQHSWRQLAALYDAELYRAVVIAESRRRAMAR